MPSYAIEMRGITKRFPGVLANDKIDLTVTQNEVHALLGENGAGKSTLMSILFGSYDPDEGDILLDGNKVDIKDPNTATRLGIGMVHQHFKLVHNYTVTENIVLGMESRDAFGMLDLKTADKRVAELSERYGLKVNPSDRIEDICVGMQQRVEILKSLYRDVRILILDEPSAVLTPQEIEELLEIIRLLKAEGKTILLITHKLKEIKAVADRCTVLRRGKNVGTVEVASVSETDMAEMMVGRSVKFNIDKKPAKVGDTVLSVNNISVMNSRGVLGINKLSLVLRSGEILGIAGIDGNGQTELLEAITGLCPITSGSISLEGTYITKWSIKRRIQAGIGYVPEDRHKHGLILDFTPAENLVVKNYEQQPFSDRFGILDLKAIDTHSKRLIEQYDIRLGLAAGVKAKNMSGGNQQKLIIAREITLSPRVLVIAQPTRGLDVGAIEYIRSRILEERDKGRAVLLISFELDEIMNLCDRIAILAKGEIVGTFNEGEIDEQRIGYLMAGSHEKEESERRKGNEYDA